MVEMVSREVEAYRKKIEKRKECQVGSRARWLRTWFLDLQSPSGGSRR